MSFSFDCFKPSHAIHTVIDSTDAKRMIPSIRLCSPSHISINTNNEITNNIGNSRLMVADAIKSGVTAIPTPKTRAIFAIFEPTAFPNANPGFPFIAAIAETTISGAEVPKPMIISPTTILETPR